MNYGLAETRQGANGIIKLSHDEIKRQSFKGYQYKIKVAKAKEYLRIYGKIDEKTGHLIFDKFLKEK